MHQPARLSRVFAPIIAAPLLAIALVIGGCEEPQPEPKPAPTPAPTEISTPVSADERAAMETFRDHTSELLEELADCSDSLLTTGNQFLEQTNQDHFDALKAQWQTCFHLYQASTALQGTSPPHRELMAEARNRLGNPLTMPGFIDSVQGYPYSGIVNDASLPLDVDSLRQQHGVTDSSEVSIGFHVVAFLLWGEQRQNPDLAARPLTDYEIAEAWEDGITDLPIEEHPNNRRRRLLPLVLELLHVDCQALLGSWEAGPLADTHQAYSEWREQQIAALLSALEQQPDNPALQRYLQTWITEQAIPGVTLPADTSEEEELSVDTLRQRLSGALNPGQDNTQSTSQDPAPTEPG